MNRLEKLKFFAETLKSDGGTIDNDMIGCVWVLQNQKRVSIGDYWDFRVIYDNLQFNNEFINEDTIDDYDPETIEKLTRKSFAKIKKDVQSGYFYLLNYYDQDGKYHDGVFKLKSGYDVFKGLEK